MRLTLSTIVVTLSLAAAPTLALAGPTDNGPAAAPSSIVTAGTKTVAAVPTTKLPTCSGDICSTNPAGGNVVNFSAVATTSYPPSPCNPDGGCTYINVTVPSKQ